MTIPRLLDALTLGSLWRRDATTIVDYERRDAVSAVRTNAYQCMMYGVISCGLSPEA